MARTGNQICEMSRLPADPGELMRAAVWHRALCEALSVVWEGFVDGADPKGLDQVQRRALHSMPALIEALIEDATKLERMADAVADDRRRARS